MYYNFPKDYLIPVINNYINKDSPPSSATTPVDSRNRENCRSGVALSKRYPGCVERPVDQQYLSRAESPATFLERFAIENICGPESCVPARRFHASIGAIRRP